MAPDIPGAPAVLVVDAHAGSARALVDLLQGIGCRVRHAGTGAESERIVGHERFDLVVMDLIFPDCNGLLLCRKLKRVTGSPIVVCSALTRKRDQVLGPKLGADDFIAKPFDLHEFEARIKAVLKRSARSKPT